MHILDQICYDTLTEIDLLICHRPQFGSKLFELLLLVFFLNLFLKNTPDLQTLYLKLFKLYQPKTVLYIFPLQLFFDFICLNILYVH